MRNLLKTIGADLAFTAGVASLANYGLKQLLPASNVKFLVVASIASVCARTVLGVLTEAYAHKLTESYGYIDKKNKTTNFIFYRVGDLFTISIGVLSPIIARTVGQRMEMQVPGYLQTLGYLTLVGCVVIIPKILLDIAAAARPKAATN